jgi:Domain of unknown function (DUF6378)
MTNEQIQQIISEYRMNEAQATIAAERAQTYGDPKTNHQAIANAWTGLLAPHAEDIAALRPVPAHVVALMMASMKICRMRLMFHEDNYDDLSVYASFAREWQRDT